MMYIRALAVVLLLGSSLPANSQKLDTLKLFYSINKSTIDEPDRLKLDSFVALHPDKSAHVRIKGFADFLWTADYNLMLSEQRAAVVASYFADKGFRAISMEGKGQVGASIVGNKHTGEPLNRRVEVIVQASKPVMKAVATNKTVTEPPKVIYTEKPISQARAGEHVILSGLTFLPGRHVVRPEAMSVARQLFDEMKKSPNLKIELQGFICCVPPGYDGLDTDTQEIKLSLNRAKAIYEYLVQRGIDSSRITYKGFGSSNHKVWPERNENDRIQNRRVEVVVIENKI